VSKSLLILTVDGANYDSSLRFEVRISSVKKPQSRVRGILPRRMETTLVLIKPGGVQRNLIGEITRRVEQRGLRVSGLKLIKAPRTTVEEHYAEHKGKGFYDEVVGYLTSGPIIAMAVTGTNAVKAIRAMMGATNPLEATPGTVRGDLALSIEDNLTHSSSDSDAAARELALWFPEGTV
jgi:nucleoside-diphosphate kinase